MLLFDIIDDLADGRKICGSFVGDGQAEFVLNGHYQFNNVEYFGIGLVKVVKHGDSCMLVLPEEVNKTYMKEWNNDIGKLMSRDFRRNDLSRYYEFITSTTRTILRRIDESDLDEFNELGFNHVKFGDFSYTILKRVPVDDLYSVIEMNGEELPKREEDPDDNYEYNEAEEMELESLSLFE